jgi:hypothetical protein
MTGSRPTVTRYLIRIAGFSLIVINFGVVLLFIYIWLSAAQKNYFERIDFTTFYTAGAIARDGQGSKIYDLAVQGEYQAKILNQDTALTHILPFNNPPYTVFPFILFSWLPLKYAFLLWTFLQLGMLFWLITILYRLSSTWSSLERWLTISGVMAFTPLLIDFMLGTFSLLLLLGLFQYYLNLKSEHSIRSAGWLILESIKPQIAFLPAILLLGARRWKTLGAGVIMGACLGLITAFWFGRQTWIDFARNINTASTNFNSFGIVPSIEYNLKGFLTMLMGDTRSNLINGISLAVLLLAVLFVFWIWRVPWQGKKDIFEVKYSLTIMLSLVLSLHLNPYDSLLLVLPAILFYRYLRGDGKSGRAFGAFLICSPYIFLIDFFILNGRIGFRFPFVIMVALTIWTAKELFFSRPQKESVAAQSVS